MKRSSKIFLSIFMLIALLVLINFELVTYGVMQLKGQLKIINASKPIEVVLEDKHFPDSLKQKIRLIQEVKRYAIDSLGLSRSTNYSDLYDQKGKPILWNVSACKPFEFKDKKWGFPVIGSFSYKGFFDYQKAVELYDKLKKEGWDVRLRTVGGWSTLGWFNDPILSNMLKRGDGRLAELIIHELTHSTLFVKDDVTTNENLATFIGEHGARLFLRQKYGDESEQLITYENRESDYLKFSDHMLSGANRLDSLYQSFDPDESTQNKERRKNAMIEEIVQQVDSIGLTDAARYKRIFEKEKPNNAYFSAYRRYRSKQSVFHDEFHQVFDNDLNGYIAYLKTKYPK